MDEPSRKGVGTYIAWGFVLGFAVAVALFNTALKYGLLSRSFLDSLAPEAVSVFFTVVVLDRLNEYRENQRERARERERQKEAEVRATEKLKADLIARLGSRVNEEAIRAAEELARHGWLHDGSLKKESLEVANLQGAPLMGAKLQEANLVVANLQGANLMLAKLHGAILLKANLQGAILQETELDAKTILPDGTHYAPEQGTAQLARFTDPNHPDFWRSDDPFSPAYRGGE